jgi:hypothetical protein
MPPTYRDRLRAEGLTLAASGAAGSVLLVALVPESRRWPLNTAAQLAVVVAILEWAGRRYVPRWLDEAREIEEGEEAGDPTPLWQLPLIMCGLAAVFGLLPQTGLPGSDRAGWDAGLRITGGCLLVGAAQALRYERMVGADERARRRRYFRVPGSRLGRTRLGFVST